MTDAAPQCAADASSGDTAAGRDALAPCPDAPRCVCSQATNARHRVAPLAYSGSRAQARAALLAVLEAMPRVRILEAGTERIHAVERSRIWGFVDDVELFLPADHRVVHVRSAARIGYYDFGANRARVERIRARFDECLAGNPAP